jgi:uncharacterized membrane protein YphA (DoxX/SURF4 family)
MKQRIAVWGVTLLVLGLLVATWTKLANCQNLPNDEPPPEVQQRTSTAMPKQEKTESSTTQPKPETRPSGAQPASNLPNQWIAVASRETPDGPTLVVTPENGEAKTYAPVADTVLISYLADRAWGRLPRLSISVSDTNRVLMRFEPAADVAVSRAELVLKLVNSAMPPSQPFEVGVYEVQAEWDENGVTWATQPKIADQPAAKASFDPKASEFRVDVTALVKRDGEVKRGDKNDAPKYGWLLKVTKPLASGSAGPQTPIPAPGEPQPFFVRWLWLPVVALVLFGLSQTNLGLVQRIAFRFSFAYWLLYSLPQPLSTLIPIYSFRLSKLYNSWVDKGVRWIAAHALGISQFYDGPSGSGDKTFDYVRLLFCFVVACAIAVVWTAVDWRRTDYPWLRDLLRSYLRYVLAFAMLGYGLAKVGSVMNQFAEPSVEQLMKSYGESSPMNLVWTFMGASRAYTRFAGLGEVVGALLLIWRRTTILGAAVSFGVMLNIVMLNFCYDVPVKQYSFHLLMMALYLLLADAPRLANLLIWNQPVDKVSLLPPYTGSRTIWVQRALKAYIIAMGIVWPLGQFVYRERYAVDTKLAEPSFYGSYEVDEFLVDGQPVPPLLTDNSRWRSLSLRRAPFGPGGVRRPTDYFSVRMMNRTQRGSPFVLSNDGKTLTLQSGTMGGLPGEISVELMDDQRLALSGIANGKKMEIKLHKLNREDFLLINRGYHWVNELPFNR